MDDVWRAASIESVAGPSKSWVDRACDRCRKRKAKCDKSMPCKNCLGASAECTFWAPVMKRGPRPRSTDDPGNSGQSPNQHISPSDRRARNPSDVDSPRRLSSANDPFQTPIAPLVQWASVHHVPQSQATTHSREEPPTVQNLPVAPPSGLSAEHASQFSLGGGESQSVGSAFDRPLEGSGVMEHVSNTTGILHQGDGHPADGSGLNPSWTETAEDPTSTDILYRDAEGQTRFLGPSSGMPLLDRLKPSGNISTRRRRRGHHADEWISLSAAIGMDIDQSTPYGHIGSTPEDTRVFRSESQHIGSWPKLEEICPGDLVDVLIRAYFSISYMLWPIVHASTFMERFNDPQYRQEPCFTALVASICCLSCRYARDPRLNSQVSQELVGFATKLTTSLVLDHANVSLVQALFNMSVVQEGTSRAHLLWAYLGPALSMAIDLGLHRKVDEWTSFNPVEIEVRKRTMWALYSQNIKASSTFGRPPLLRLTDLDIDEPCPVDDVHITLAGINQQPTGSFSVVAGFVIAVRLHMILERTIQKINAPLRPASKRSSFSSLVTANTGKTYSESDELSLLLKVTDGLGSQADWAFTSTTIVDPDNAAFFQKTRAFTLQHFIRLLIARHQFFLAVSENKRKVDGNASTSGSESNGAGHAGLHEKMVRMSRSALAIVGTYSAIDAQGRLGFFGAHAIVQLSQAGAGLVGLILHLRNDAIVKDESIHQLALQGLPTAIRVLRQLGNRRPAGLRAADVLLRFAKTCNITVFLGLSGMPWLEHSELTSPTDALDMGESAGSDNEEDVPMLRTLTRRPSPDPATSSGPPEPWLAGEDFDQWLNLALQEAQSGLGAFYGELQIPEEMNWLEGLGSQ